MFDVTLFTTLTGLIVGVGWAYFFPDSYQEHLASGGNGYIFAWLMMPFAMVLDAGVYAMCGNTPGKALVGIRVTSVDGRHLSYGNALRRNFGIYWSGLGTGFPIVTLGTVLHAHSVVSGGQLTSWDKNVGSQALGRKSAARTWVGAVAYFALLAGLAQLK
jgi:uncharacterized RDD family membrane protein YckC